MDTPPAPRSLMIGMVGAGAVAHRHAASLRELAGVQLAGVVDTDAARAGELAKGCGGRSYASVGAMLAAEPLDAVYVCVPPFAHGEPELAALGAGLPLFVEKPIAIDLPLAEEIAAAVREAGVPTAVGYHWRYLDIAERMRDLAVENEPRLLVGYWLDKVPPSSWWTERARSGGQVVEQATHVLDLLRFVAGEVSEVHSRSGRGTRRGDIADVTAATFTLESGAVGALVSTCLMEERHRVGLDVFCDGLALEFSEEELVVTRGSRATPQRARSDAKTLADRDFIEAVRGPVNHVRAPYEEALATQRLACAIRASAEGATQPVRPPRRARTETVRSLGVAEPGRAAFFELPLQPMRDGGFRVDTIYTGLSAGTELSFFKGTNPQLSAGWDPELGVFGERRRSYPVKTLGYMETSVVTAADGGSVAAGQTVAMAYGHKAGHTADPARDRFVALPEELDPLLGIYVAHMGPICANGLLHAAAEFAGGEPGTLGDGVRDRNVLVMGAGVVGLLTGLFAVHHGAASVTVADTGRRRLEAARGLGLDAVDQDTQDVWRVLKERHRHGPGDRGADVAFQCRARAESLAEALRGLRPQGAVIDLAFYSGGAEALRLGEEFHHNGLAIRCAQIGRVPRGMAASWNRGRLSGETLALLRSRGDDVRRELITDVVPIDQAPRLFEELAARRREVIQAVFEVSP